MGDQADEEMPDVGLEGRKQQIIRLIESIQKKHPDTFGTVFNKSGLRTGKQRQDCYYDSLPLNNQDFLDRLIKYEAMSKDEADKFLRDLTRVDIDDLKLENLHKLEEIENFINVLLLMGEREEGVNGHKSKEMPAANSKLYNLLMSKIFKGPVSRLLNELQLKISMIQDPVIKTKTCEALQSFWNMAAFHSGFDHSSRRELRRRGSHFDIMIVKACTVGPPVPAVQNPVQEQINNDNKEVLERTKRRKMKMLPPLDPIQKKLMDDSLEFLEKCGIKQNYINRGGFFDLLPKDNDYHSELVGKFVSMTKDEAKEYLNKLPSVEVEALSNQKLYDLTEIEKFINVLIAIGQRQYDGNDKDSDKTEDMHPEVLKLYMALVGGISLNHLLYDLKIKISMIEDKSIRSRTCQALSSMYFIASFHSDFNSAARQNSRQRAKRTNAMIEEAMIADPPVIENSPAVQLSEAELKALEAKTKKQEEILKLNDSIISKHPVTFADAFKLGKMKDDFLELVPLDNQYLLELWIKIESMDEQEALRYCQSITDDKIEDFSTRDLFKLEAIERMIDQLLALAERDALKYVKSAVKSTKFKDQMPAKSLKLYEFLTMKEISMENLLLELSEKIRAIDDEKLKIKTCEALLTLYFKGRFHLGLYRDARRTLGDWYKRFVEMVNEILKAHLENGNAVKPKLTKKPGDVVLRGFVQNVGGAGKFTMRHPENRLIFGKYDIFGLLEHMWSKRRQAKRAFSTKKYKTTTTFVKGKNKKPKAGEVIALKEHIPAKEVKIDFLDFGGKLYISSAAWDIVIEDFEWRLVYSYVRPGVTTFAMSMYFEQIVEGKPYLIAIDANPTSAADVRSKNSKKRYGDLPDLGHLKDFLEKTGGTQENTLCNKFGRFNELFLTNMVLHDVKQAKSVTDNVFKRGFHSGYEYLVNVTQSKILHLLRSKTKQ